MIQTSNLEPLQRHCQFRSTLHFFGHLVSILRLGIPQCQVLSADYPDAAWSLTRSWLSIFALTSTVIRCDSVIVLDFSSMLFIDQTKFVVKTKVCRLCRANISTQMCCNSFCMCLVISMIFNFFSVSFLCSFNSSSSIWSTIRTFLFVISYLIMIWLKSNIRLKSKHI